MDGCAGFWLVVLALLCLGGSDLAGCLRFVWVWCDVDFGCDVLGTFGFDGLWVGPVGVLWFGVFCLGFVTVAGGWVVLVASGFWVLVLC